MSDYKHNPLSPEELLRLLDKKTNPRENDLDEFDQEALEGFAMLENTVKAQQSVEEINKTISERITENKGTQKNRIIWFSAAASVVLIILVSIIFFKQTKQDSNVALALNEQREKKGEVVSPNVQAAGEIAPAEPVNTEVKNMKKDLPQFPDHTVALEKKVSAPQSVTSNKPYLSESGTTFGAGNANEELKTAEQESRNGEADVQLKDIVAADKLETGKKEQEVREENSPIQGYSIAQNTARSQSETDETKELKKEDSRNTKAYKSQEKSNETIVSSSVATKSAAPAQINNNYDASYYPGGELAIKEFVLNYLKSKQYMNTITGTYKVKGIVSGNGNLKVISIVQTSSENCNCTDRVKEALNAMTKWNTYTAAGKKTSPELEFILGF